MQEELRIAGKPNPLDEFRFPWSKDTFDVLKIAGEPNGIDALKIAQEMSDTEALRVVQGNKKETDKSVDMEEYFEEMELTSEEVEEREKTSDALEKAFLFMLALLLLLRKKGIKAPQIVVELTIVRIKYELLQIDIEFELVRRYVEDIVPKLVDSTYKNIGNAYMTSVARAKELAVNETNSVHNTLDYVRAVNKGYKYKIWHTMRDERVRHTHELVDNMRLGINERFVVGDCLMRYAHDTENGTSDEISNCRCTMEYVK